MKILVTAACAIALASLVGGIDAAHAWSVAGSSAQQSDLDSGRLDPVLASPRVGDVYAVDLSAFSHSVYNVGHDDGWDSAGTFGLLKVVEVRADRVIAIPEDSAWDHPRGAIDDLNGNLAAIGWDARERISIRRAEFAWFVDEEKILEVRRP